MLRVSVDHIGEHTFEPPHVISGVGDAGLPAGSELLSFVDAVVLRDVEEYPDARAALDEVIGPDGTDRAAMVAGNFSMMNRALDAVGAPVGAGFTELAADLGVTIPDHLLR